MFAEFRELHGDRTYADDPAIVGGLARFNGSRAWCIGHQKGRDTKEKIHRNFGMPRPEGYRKALRLMKLAEKFGLPLFTFIDTPGAYPGIGAEERGQSEAIGRNLYEMAGLRIPVIVTVIGEGGSGGALAIAIGDMTLMLQYATYSVISPEGCASILWKSAEHASEAAEILGITAPRLKQLGLIDKVVNEPLGGAHRDHAAMMVTLKKALTEGLRHLAGAAARHAARAARGPHPRATASTRKSPPADDCGGRRWRNLRQLRPDRTPSAPRLQRSARSARSRRCADRRRAVRRPRFRGPARCAAARRAGARASGIRSCTSIMACRRTPDAWQRFCADLCAERRRRAVGARGRRVRARRRPASRARRGALRYAALRRWRRPPAWRSSRSRITATTRRRRCCCSCMRGAGPHGLAAMGAARADARGVTLLRPLLDIARAAIDAYAVAARPALGRR